jgi:hypothetical protein
VGKQVLKHVLKQVLKQNSSRESKRERKTTTGRRRFSASERAAQQEADWSALAPDAPLAALRDAYQAARVAHPDRHAPGLGDPRNTPAHAARILDGCHDDVALAVAIIGGAFRVGTHWMRTNAAFTLAGIAQEIQTLCLMHKRGELR